MSRSRATCLPHRLCPLAQPHNLPQPPTPSGWPLPPPPLAELCSLNTWAASSDFPPLPTTPRASSTFKTP